MKGSGPKKVKMSDQGGSKRKVNETGEEWEGEGEGEWRREDRAGRGYTVTVGADGGGQR